VLPVAEVELAGGCEISRRNNMTQSATAATRDSPIESEEAPRRPPFWLILAAFAAVYVIWGSTYLGIRLAIDSMPPLLMAGTRFFAAGCLLYGIMRARGAVAPVWGQWRDAAIIGAALLLVGNGGVTVAQQTVPSIIAALMVAAVPLWMILIDWLRPAGRKPPAWTFVGVLLGFTGVAIIVLGKGATPQGRIDPFGAALLVLAPLCWAAGSVFSRYARKPAEALLSIGMQMIAGGVLLLLFGVAAGELPKLDWQGITFTSWMAFLYLTFAGSLVGFTAYVWLLQVSTPAHVATYAYVNPLIAVLLGRAVLRESLPQGVLVAGALIISSVVMITRASSGKGNKAVGNR
jgi:drug/metabolite transporter (DMT)-like permease